MLGGHDDNNQQERGTIILQGNGSGQMIQRAKIEIDSLVMVGLMSWQPLSAGTALFLLHKQFTRFFIIRLTF
jgi:hypothetical protein